MAQVKAGDTYENLLNKNQTNRIFFVSRKRNYLKSMQQYNEFTKVIKQNGCYIYESQKL